MNGIRRIFYLVILLFLTETPSGQNPPQLPRYISLYRQAEKLYFDQNTNDIKDSAALATYLKVIELHNAAPDSILWDSYFKAGIYLQTFGRQREAIPYFAKAISLFPQVTGIKEKLMYLPNLYLGNSYYAESMLDSAVYYYKRAEEIAQKYPAVEGIERLFNTLGAVNYESGDYQQSKIYFEKALEIISAKKPVNVALLVNYKNNLASSLRKLKQYDQAMMIFNELLKYDVNRDEILHNIGSIYLEQGKDSLAIVNLQRVGYNNQNKFNDLGIAYSRLDEMDSAISFYKRAAELNEKLNGNRKNIQYAITCKNLGDYYISAENYDSALVQFQQAIIQLVFDFNEPDIRLNPTEFNGQYSVIELFESFSAKAKTLTLRYYQQHDKDDLVSSIYAYDAMYRLADYVIRTYNSEEAMLLLTGRKHLSHTEPINNSLELFKITKDDVFLRHAFRFDEKNKATMLALRLQESLSKRNAGLPSELLAKEKQLNHEIASLQFKSFEIADSSLREQGEALLLDKQLQLADIHKKFNEFPSYRKLKFIDNTIDIKSALAMIPSDYAVLSYHVGDTSLLAFLLTKKSFKHFTVKKDSSLYNDIGSFYRLVQAIDRNISNELDSLSRRFYDLLISPFEKDISDFENLVIIPDDELLYLPFELLKNVKGKMLLRSHSITYNYSCSLLRGSSVKEDKRAAILAMAPFIQSLPASEKEIEGIKGEKLKGKQATKEFFIKKAGEYAIIHLATHATANDSVPSLSYISFYPQDSSELSSRLYTPEIAMLPLSAVQLVILSACETGTGQLIKGEGLMSLTRSFSNAGCQNIIASLWKADDESSYRINGALHHSLEKNRSAAVALRDAKLNYLDDDDIPLRVKSPAYWANLRLVGTFQNDQNNRGYFWIILLSAIALGAIIYFSMRRS